MLRKTLLVVLWFPLTFILLIVNLSLLVGTTRTNHYDAEILNPVVAEDSRQRLAASGGTAQILGMNVIAGDARALLLEAFLSQYKSPMAPYANLIVREADDNGFDFRLLVAIAMCESNLGKRMPSKDSFNPFGIGVYTGQNSGKKFESWEHTISWASRYLREKYYNQGISDLNDIGAIWAPPSVANGYSWTNCVKSFQSAIL